MNIALRCLAALLLAGTASAQTASLRGQIQDESGAILPGATVRLRAAGQPARTATADKTGAYLFAGLAAGDYTVEASAAKLSPSLSPPSKSLSGSGEQVLNLTLAVATVTEKVTVAADAAPALTTEAANNASARWCAVCVEPISTPSPTTPDDLAADLQAPSR